LLDGKPVSHITAFLFAGGTDETPRMLSENSDHSFEGFKIGGQGFLFADGDPECTPLAARDQLVGKNARNGILIKPYIGGEDVNTHPLHRSSRFVMNFGTRTLEEADQWPDLMAIVRAKVKPQRDLANRDSHRIRWWQFAEVRPGLVAATRNSNRVLVVARVLVCSQVSAQFCFAWQPTDRVFSHALNIFARDEDAFFTVMQSRAHEFWARFFGSSMKDDLRYTPSDCFETFPFPHAWESGARLEAIGGEYYAFRAKLMVDNNEGLTKTYNRFHDPNERDPRLVQLRALHDAMDRAVLDAYGWTDVRPACEFIAEYEAEPDEAEATGGRKKKRPMRYRWPDEVRDEVLARLVELNAVRAKEDERARAEAKVQRTLGGFGG